MSAPPQQNGFLEELKSAEAEMRDRMMKYTAAWQAGDLDTIMSYFVDEGLDYSDYGIMALHMDKKALTEAFKQMATLFGDMKLETTSVRGAVDFCVWECIFEFTLKEDMPGVPYQKGERCKLFSASTIEWNAEGKIVKERDYAVWAKPAVKHG